MATATGDYAIIKNSTLSGIANAIRTKNTSLGSATMTAAQMAAYITAIGGSGAEYEQGTYSPASDIARATISFASTHSSAPCLIMMTDATGTIDTTTNSNINFMFVDYYKLSNCGYSYSSSAYRYAIAYYNYRNTSTSSTSITGYQMTYKSSSSTSSSATYPRYWAT